MRYLTERITEKGKMLSNGQRLVAGVYAKMSDSTEQLLEAAGVDIIQLIQSAGESFINRALK